MKHRLFSALGIALVTAILLGCTTAKMATELRTTSTEMKVEGLFKSQFNGKLKFGAYEVSDLNRSWTTRSKWTIVVYESSKAKQHYEFKLKDPSGKTWVCDCATGMNRKGFNLENFMGTGGELQFDIQGSTLFTCVFTREGEEQAWRMVLGMPYNNAVMKGGLTDGKTAIHVTGTQKLEGSPIPLMEASGYEFSMDGARIGAVEVMNDGAVWLKDGIDSKARDAVAAASAALLLYRDINDR